MEFGCVMIGDNNCVQIPDNVQVGCEIDVQIPIVNMTRHRLHYYIKMYEQRPKPETKPSSTQSSIYSGYEEFETDGMEQTEFKQPYKPLLDNSTCSSAIEIEDTKSLTTMSNSTRLTSIESTQSLNVLKFKNFNNQLDSEQSPFVFKFDKIAGELAPNEKFHLKLSFCPLKSVPYTIDAKCYLMCNDFPEIVNILPVVIKGRGCKTRFEVKIKYLLFSTRYSCTMKCSSHIEFCLLPLIINTNNKY